MAYPNFISSYNYKEEVYFEIKLLNSLHKFYAYTVFVQNSEA